MTAPKPPAPPAPTARKVYVPIEAVPPMTLAQFMRVTGLSRTRTWHYRDRGWLEVIFIAGRCWVTAEAIVNFNRRAKAGEFNEGYATQTPPMGRRHRARGRPTPPAA